ncbi:lysophospholipid acyltransferase family protein [Congregibacter litoralis]|uniref:Putative hemolysin n=1 Tax=Congregibacter litoralis KT71 TaxID=314285 RepID=A4A9U5_9GAMM|nr:lysophospholipid acyltransferase family protein [Congregibacter litoralis]EAQ97262.1 putative hemolysin [Congregibacter litoralis KT71]
MYDYVRAQPSLSYAQPSDPWLTRRCISFLEVLLGRRRIEAIYYELKRRPFHQTTFFSEALDAINVNVDMDMRRLLDAPKNGPLVILANHPFGIVDGLILCNIAAQLRSDFRIMLNAMLCQDSDLAPHFLPIDFQSNKAALQNNIQSKKLALSALKDNIPLLIFPSGMVSTADKFGFGQSHDGTWTTFAAKLIQQSEATVLPVYFHGQNSRKFHVASHVALPLRMAMLMHEALKKCGDTVRVDLGDPLPWETLSRYGSRLSLTQFLYSHVNEELPLRASQSTFAMPM